MLRGLAVIELVMAGGWLMVPILICSVLAMAIVGERLWVLQTARIVPPHLVNEVLQHHLASGIDREQLVALREHSPLGRVLAAGLVNLAHSREVMKESLEDAGRQVVQELERFLNTLGTIATITPLLGLLGTVIGMIKVFAAITAHGVGNPAVLAGGISEALITTAAGLAVAIPSLMFYRYFRGKVTMIVLRMEEEALRLVEVIHGEREREPG
jgi:biopolymer transport protein ExbB